MTIYKKWRMHYGNLQSRKPVREEGKQCACGLYHKDGECSWDYWKTIKYKWELEGW